MTEGSCRCPLGLQSLSTGLEVQGTCALGGYHCGLRGVPHCEGQRRPLVLSRGTGAPGRGPKQYALGVVSRKKSCCCWRSQWLEEK